MSDRSQFLRFGAALVVLFLAAHGIAAVLKTDTAKSVVTITFKQLGVPVEAKFKKFTSQIDFDSAKLESVKANVNIDIASFDLGDADINREVAKKEWFSAAQFPTANFTASTLKAAADGKLEVSGKLTIKGKTTDVRFPLTVRKEGGNQIFEGTLPIKRLAFDIGEGEWKDTSTVADEVLIKFRVVTAQ